MSAEEFNELPPHLQATLALDHGHYIHHRIKGWCKIDLYWLYDFYVELWFLYDMKSIGLVRALTSNRQLEPYLETIKLKLKTQKKDRD
ncbi:hypothetical protein [Pontibacter chinhatensis]|uniref:Uncharacterized protein n=1 Tax=Pontibacter chinhatensis TaxID=1436961 RepID=A0A1I2QSF6_9BACT|nr:hypothetical protein [Pontibacter chinhatensis]SFG30583.1 hypothetical protein SAMN05421739_10286 [Pontibacter chinhatensis]